MSEQTRQLFANEFWEFVSELEVPPTLVFSRADFEHLDAAERQAEYEENMGNLQGLGLNIPELIANIYQQFEDHSSLRHNAGAYSHDRIIPILRENGHLFGLDMSILPEDVRVDIVSVMSDDDVRGFFSAVSGIPVEEMVVEDMPVEDLRAFVMFHEIGHLVHADPGMSRLESEWMAEMYAHEAYQKAYEAGIVSTPDLPLVFSQARAMNAFSQGQLYTLIELGDNLVNLMPDYEMTAIAAAYEPGDDLDYDGLSTDLNDAYKTILVEVGMSFSESPKFEYDAHIAALGPIYRTMLENDEISDELQTNIIQFMRDIGEREMEILDQEIAYKKGERSNPPDEIDYEPLLAEFKQLLAIPEQYQATYQDNYESYMLEKAETVFLNEGLELSRGQPELIYTAVRNLLEQGAFNDNFAGATLAEYFVRGSEMLAPNYFGVNDTAGSTYSELNPLEASNATLETQSSGSIEQDTLLTRTTPF